MRINRMLRKSLIESASFLLWIVAREERCGKRGLKTRHYTKTGNVGSEDEATTHLVGVLILALVAVYLSISISVVRLGSWAAVLAGGLG
jgi:hypothetical protein